MKRFLKSIILNKTVANWLIKPILRLHSCCYKWAGRFAIVLNDGIHPKHHILKYKEWFFQNVEQGFAHAIRRWTQAFVLGTCKRTTAKCASHDPHEGLGALCGLALARAFLRARSASIGLFTPNLSAIWAPSWSESTCRLTASTVPGFRSKS